MLTRRRRDTLVLLLAWAAGSVDAIGYLGLDHVFTANMTGNTVLLGLSLGQAHGLAAISNVMALAGFILGVALGAMIVEKGGKPGVWDRRVTEALFLEALMLAAFTLLWHLTPGGAERSSAALYLLIALTAVAMGIQSAAVRRLNLPGVATTYVTGTITSLISGFTRRLHIAQARAPQKESAAEAKLWDHEARLQASVFLTYGISAMASGLFQTRVPWLVAVTPLLALALVLLVVAFAHRKHESRQM
jgi:uncharacterized membrane protein YoaK (UPF0700 family)